MGPLSRKVAKGILYSSDGCFHCLLIFHGATFKGNMFSTVPWIICISQIVSEGLHEFFNATWNEAELHDQIGPKLLMTKKNYFIFKSKKMSSEFCSSTACTDTFDLVFPWPIVFADHFVQIWVAFVFLFSLKGNYYLFIRFYSNLYGVCFPSLKNSNLSLHS